MQAALGHRNYRGGARRALDLGVAASVALHALLLFGVAGAHESLRHDAAAPAPLLARLAPAEPARGAPQAALAPAQNARPQTPAAKSDSSGPPAAAPTAEARAAITGTADSARGETAHPAPAAPPAQAANAAGTAARAESSPIAAADAPPAKRADAATLAAYRAAIFSAARRHLSYPRVALDNDWEGRAEVRLVFRADGALGALRLTASAGHAVLDAQAIEMLRKAAHEARPPAALHGREFIVDVPVTFILQEPSA